MDGGWSLVDLAAPVDEAEARADRIRHWLLYEHIVIPNPTRDDLWQPSALAPGPAWRLVVGDVDDGFLRIADNGVDVQAGWAVRGAPELSAPCCTRCGTVLPLETYRTLVSDWEASQCEPAPTCGQCAASVPLSSWAGEEVALAGSMAVTFRHWPRPCPLFLLAAGQRLGSRVGFAPLG